MNTSSSVATDLATAGNIIPLITAKPQAKKPAAKLQQRFSIVEFVNRTGTISWRVSGIKRDGTRIRQNFSDGEHARARQNELETEYLVGHVDERVTKTALSEDKLKLAEMAFLKLGDDWQRILDAVDYWQRTGAKNLNTEAPRIDDAVEQYLKWLDHGAFRDATKQHWKTRMNVFKNSVPNILVSEVTPETIEAFLEKRNVSPTAKDTDRRAVSRFFSWCIERPRRWVVTNPCREVKTEVPSTPPVVLTVDEAEALMRAAEKFKGGRLVPYIAVGLFEGLRPFEARRLTWEQVNLSDSEIRIEAWQNKNEKSRVIEICDATKAWLAAHKDKPFFPSNWRKDFEALIESVGFGASTKEKPNLKPWTKDLLRHTACSHFFRRTESYGKTAEHFDNSEAIIKKHYQGRVRTAETIRFYACTPKAAKKK